MTEEFRHKSCMGYIILVIHVAFIDSLTKMIEDVSSQIYLMSIHQKQNEMKCLWSRDIWSVLPFLRIRHSIKVIRVLKQCLPYAQYLRNCHGLKWKKNKHVRPFSSSLTLSTVIDVLSLKHKSHTLSFLKQIKSMQSTRCKWNYTIYYKPTHN